MAFRVRCKCGELARVCSSNEMGAQFKQLYCQCTDPFCGHTFVVNVEFDHTISPSAHDFPEALRQRIHKTLPTEQAGLFDDGDAG